jgi:hypothetical protein
VRWELSSVVHLSDSRPRHYLVRSFCCADFIESAFGFNQPKRSKIHGHGVTPSPFASESTAMEDRQRVGSSPGSGVVPVPARELPDFVDVIALTRTTLDSRVRI